MIPKILISPSLDLRIGEINKLLADVGLKNPHPDLLYFDYDQKLGIAETKKIRAHLSFKPFQAKGRGVVLEDASQLTVDAQNALLKTLEEPPPESLIILATSSDTNFLPTILSRCEVIRVQVAGDRVQKNNYTQDIEKLLEIAVEGRFKYIEKLKDREEFLHALVSYFHQNLTSHMESGNKDFLHELLQAEKFAKQNVNIRAILEYLMLKMPSPENN